MEKPKRGAARARSGEERTVAAPGADLARARRLGVADDVLRDLVDHLQVMKTSWLAALDSVEPFVRSRPAEETGCLYYSASRQAFVDPREAADAVPHFGRPGGVLPRVAD